MPAEIIDLQEHAALADDPVVHITLVAHRRADGRLVWAGETLIREPRATCRRYDAAISRRYTELAHAWDPAQAAGGRRAVRARRGRR